MIVESTEYPHQAELHADVAVVGSGLAGVETARQLAAAGLNVIVLESGRRHFDADLQHLNDAEMAGKPHRRYEEGANFHGYLPAHYRGLNRVRQFGGTSNSWTGKWRAFTDGDFDAKPWIGDGGWPIRLNDLVDSYRAVARDYGLGDVFAEADAPHVRLMADGVRPSGLKIAVHYWEKTQTRVPDRFGTFLGASERITLVLGATVTEIVLDDATRSRVTRLECRTPEGRSLTVQARASVLATGGLEVPRLLLNSDRQCPRGIGNARDNVGRYYIEHPKDQSAILDPDVGLAPFASLVQNTPRPRFCASFSLDDDVLERYGLLRHSIYLKPTYETRLGKARRVLRLTSRRRETSFVMRDRVGVLRHYRVKYATEQVPHRDSRVRLGDARDAMNVRRLVVDWRFTPRDERSITAACHALTDAFATARLGRLRFPADPMTLDRTMDAAHPMGTARMAATPQEGVVDRDCRVFGTENLYVASGAVFPTGSVYSPTYTIVALANRLGRYLASRLTHPVSPNLTAAEETAEPLATVP